MRVRTASPRWMQQPRKVLTAGQYVLIRFAPGGLLERRRGGKLLAGEQESFSRGPRDQLVRQLRVRSVISQAGALTMAFTLAAILMVACSDDNRADDRAERSDTTEPERETSQSTGDPDQDEAVISAYEEAFQARVEVLAPPRPDPDDPQLAETHTGPMLEQIREVALGLQVQGRAIRYPEDSQHQLEVESVAFRGEDIAILDVCAVDDGERIVVATGEVLAGGVFTGRITAAMQYVDGRWKLAETQQGEQQRGVTGCALD